MDKSLIQIFRGDDTDGLGYQSIQGKITTTLDLTGCRAVFRYLGFTQEFDPIPENGRITITMPASATSKFPPGLGYASLRVYDSENKVRTFTNRIPVFVTVYAPSECGGEFEVVFNGGNLELEPLKIKSVNGYRIYDGYLEQIIDKATAIEYGLALLFDSGDLGKDANSGYAATPKAVQAAYEAVIQELTDNYYTATETDEAIDRIAAYYITSDAQGNPFETYAALMNATVFYSGGQQRTPTRNDYCVVLADETHGGEQYRYIYSVNQQGVGQWEAQYAVGGSVELDNTVTRTSTNGVKSSGIWSAIWGALTAVPGFSSLYDWCVAQLAGKASTADATLTPIYSDTPTFSEWTFSGTSPSSGHHWEVLWDIVSGEYRLYEVLNGQTWEDAAAPQESVVSLDDDLTIVVFPMTGVTATRTRTDIIGYRLGSQSDKPLQPKGDYAPATGIAKSALAQSVQASLDKADTALQSVDVDPLFFAQYYPDGSVKSAAEFTADIKYDDPDVTNRTIAVKPFCNTGTAANDNSSLVGRVVIPPFVDGDGNGHIADDGTRYRVVEVSGYDGLIGDDIPNLTAIVAPNTVTNIGSGAFSYCDLLTSVSLPAVTNVGLRAFSGCFNLPFVSLPAATYIEREAFADCSKITSVSLPTVTRIKGDAFGRCFNLASVSLPAVTQIGLSTFGRCTSLTSVSIPVATRVDGSAFERCTALDSVDFGGTPRPSVPTLGTDVFDSVPTSCKIIVPDAQYDAWVAASSWSSLVAQGYKFLRHSEWEYARKYDVDSKAPLASPAFTGTPTAPTPASGDNSTKVATTAFVQDAVGGITPGPDNTKLNSTSAAPAFDATATYDVGNYVTYNGTLYRCTTAVTVAGEWNAANWTADTMTDPDAVLDITSQNQLRVVAKDGTLLWAQGYDLASTSSATLTCDKGNLFTFADGATTQAFTLPTAPSGKVGDFILDIDNSANTGAASISMTGLDSTFSLVVPKGENLTDMFSFAAGEMAELYFTQTTFTVNNLPTWKIVKQVVENGGVTA